MNNYARSLSLLFSVLLFGCATGVPNPSEAPAEQKRQEFFVKHVERTAHRLELGAVYFNDEVDQLLVIIEELYGSTIGVSLVSDVSSDPNDPFEYYILEAVIWDRSKDSYRRAGEVGEFVSVIKRYVTDVKAADADRVSKRLDMTGFFEMEFADPFVGSCARPTDYFILAKFETKQNLIWRGRCDPSYADDIAAVDLLFDLAIEHFPMIADKLGEIESSILNQ